jgi:threonine/homoserine/homoserine lactone efflux protein
MPGFVTVLPLALVMVAGPQIITAVFLATSENWRKNSAAFLAGVLLTVTFFVTLAYLVTKLVRDASDDSDTSGQAIDVVLVLLLLFAALYVFRTRKTAEPPKWMGKLQTATPKLSFRLGLLLLGVFPTDILTSTTVGSYLATNGDPWWYCLSFVFATLFLEALPVLLVLVLGKRAEVFLPKTRDWMNANSWIISEAVIVFFIVLQINSLAGS